MYVSKHWINKVLIRMSEDSQTEVADRRYQNNFFGFGIQTGNCLDFFFLNLRLATIIS